MNKSNKIGILLIVSLLMTLGFYHNSKAEENLLYLGTDNVYYKCQGKPMTPQTDDTNGDNKITSVDLASVKILNNTFFTDKNNVYYVGTFNYYCYFYKLVGADTATFKVLNDLYEKDKNSVYYNSFYHGGPGIDKVQNADSASFEVFKEDKEYGMDKNSIFFQGKLLVNQSQIITNTNLYNSIKGKIILKTESNGEAFYVSPNKKEMYSLSRPIIAFRVMREQGIGINNANLEKIPVGGNCPNYNSSCDISNKYDLNFVKNQKGKIFIQVEGSGEAWYVNPKNSKRYFLGRPTDAFNIMKNLSLGISNANFDSLTQVNNQVSPLCTTPPTGTDMGRDIYPINTKYKGLNFLGQLFTAYSCSAERVGKIFGVKGNDYTLGSSIQLKTVPNDMLLNTLKSIGFKCANTETSCKNWELWTTIKVNDLMKLEPFYNYFESDDCTNCG